jgi:WD40 repeat protein
MKIPGPARNAMNSVVLSKKSASYFVASADGGVFTGDYEKLTSSPTGVQNLYPNKVVALSKDEKIMVVGTDSAAIQIYAVDRLERKPTAVIKSLKGATNDIEFLPDNSGFVVSKSDKSLSIVDHRSGNITPVTNIDYELKALSISPNGQRLAGASWSGKLVLINMKTKTSTVIYSDDAAQFLSVKVSPDGNPSAFGTYEIKDKRGLVKIFDMKSRKRIDRQFTGHKAGVFDVEFSPDGKLLASAGADARVQMWVLDFPEDLPIVMENNRGFIRDIEFSKESNYLVAACRETELRVWPTNPDILASQVCPQLKRNMTPDEWEKYIGDNIKYESTCVNLLISDF